MDKTINKIMRVHKTNCPFQISAGHNIDVWFADLGIGTRGMYRKTMRRKYIVINQDLDEVWRRVICAHELGHAILHPAISRFWMDEHTYFNAGRYERQANRFAVHLLSGYDKPAVGESLADMLFRNGIPEELHSFY